MGDGSGESIMGLEFRSIINCDQSYHDNVDDDWKEEYYVLKQSEDEDDKAEQST